MALLTQRKSYEQGGH